VTSFEPRTLHQPEKLQNVSKNDYGFTTPIFYVNEIQATITSYSSIECRACTGGWTGNCATGSDVGRNLLYWWGVLPFCSAAGAFWGRNGSCANRRFARM